MRLRSAVGAAFAALLLSSSFSSVLVAQESLTIVSAGPEGELAKLAQVDEIRVRFSEPMVTLGKIPDVVTAPFFAVQPAIAGTFRWAGPTILVFTPDPKRPLPYATRYEVVIGASATAVSGRRLAQPYRFTFTTPTVHLLSTTWYRLNGRYDQLIKIVLRFNQPVRPGDVFAHATLRYEPHQWRRPMLSAVQRSRMGAQAVAAFDRKLAAADQAAASRAPMPMSVAFEWDQKKYPASPDLVVLETIGAPATEGHLQLTLDRRLPSIDGAATPGGPQSQVLTLEPTLFVDAFRCEQQCDADRFNPAVLRSEVDLQALQRAVAIRDVTDSAREPVVVQPSASTSTPRRLIETVRWFNVEDLGYDRQPPSHTYTVTIDAGLQALDGQVLGHTWTGYIENWHDRAFTSFGDGHGVWEKTGGTLLPFYARNYTAATEWASPLGLDQLMPTILALEKNRFRETPASGGVRRTLGVKPDAVQSHGLELKGALNASSSGLVWAAVLPGTTIRESRPYIDDETPARATIVQVTNLGITVKDSPLNTLIFVTRLDDASPVGGADVSIIGLDNEVRWRGRTDDHGVAIAPQTRFRDPRRWYEFAFIVTASRDGDVAYVGSDWNEGISPYEFGSRFDLSEAGSLLRGTVFADRGVYKLGEEVHVKAVLRSDSASGIELLKAGTPVYVEMRDSRDKVVDTRTVTMNQWSTSDWKLTLPAQGALGSYQLIVALDKESLEADRAPAKPSDQDEPEWQPYWRKQLRGSFLVAAYRRPDFRVDATLGSALPFSGTSLQGVVTGRYLFGASMAKRAVSWALSRAPVFSAPVVIADKYPFDRFAFVGCCDDNFRPQLEQLESRSGTLDDSGQLALDLGTRSSNGLPYEYTLEGDVEDVSRQHIANRASVLIHPASFYVGLVRPPFFVDQKQGLRTAVVAVSPAGAAVPGVSVDVTLTEVQWHSVRRAEGNGFYTWETERKEVEAGQFTATTGAEPVPLEIPLPSGGFFVVKATARDAEGRVTTTRMSFYAMGSGYTAWQRYDHNRIDLVPERQSYKPGDVARIMIQSPWERATALLTVEREGIRSYTPFTLTSTQQTVEVPIAAADIPNVYVSVLLVKGRTRPDADEDASDPGKPAFRLGYTMLTVEDASKRLKVRVTSNKEEFRPAGAAKVDVDVKDAAGAAAPSEVTLWAVDYGVLSLTAFRTPDVLGSVYVQKSLQVVNTDNRERIVSRRVLTPKGSDEGGGGGGDEGSSADLRKDFRVLAFWLGSVATDARGHASVDVKLPESLTTYRIMAVTGDRLSRFGSGESEIRINKPVVLKPAFPRFLTRGDKASFGSVVTSQLKTAGSAVVTMKSLDPAVLEITGVTRKTVPVPAGGSVEVRFDVVARGTGRGRVQTTVSLGGENDGFEDAVPIEVLTPPESVAAYGEAAPDSKQTITIPTGVIPGLGGLHLELASTALVGLGEGARYVVEYPYGCVEQRSSRVFVMAMAADLGDAFHLPGIDPKDLRPRVQTGLRELEEFQCPSGGFALWPGACLTVSPYLTSYVLHVFQQAQSLKYDVNAEVMDRAYKYLERAMAQPQPVNEGWWPAYTAWEAFAVKVLVAGGRNQDSNINRLYGYLDRMPVFAIAYLHDALTTTRPGDARLAELRRRLANAVLPEAGTSHVEELSDPYLLYFWNSNVRSTSIVLDTLVRSGTGGPDITGLVRWLMTARKNGRWGNTQENALAMQALVNYYRKYESRVPNFTATIRSGTEELVRQTFRERSAEAVTRDIPMTRLAASATPGTDRDLTFRREGDGTLFYTARLTYTRDQQDLPAFDSGFHIERQYATLRDGRTLAPSTSFVAGDLVQVTISLDLPKERRFVAVTDPLPAGVEAVESWFATTAADVNRLAPDDDPSDDDESDWLAAWRRGTFDHVERHDDRVLLFATRLSEGHHEFTYVVRAITAGTFQTAPASAEEMYAPEIFGRTNTRTIEVRP